MSGRRRYRLATRRRLRWWKASASSTRSIRAASTWGWADPGSGADRRPPRSPALSERAPTTWREVDGVVIPAPFDQAPLMKSDRLRARMSVLAATDARNPRTSPNRSPTSSPCWTAATHVDGVELHAVPGEQRRLTPWIFGSSKGQSAQVAGARGLPFVASYHITPAHRARRDRRVPQSFQPSAALSEPYVVVSADVVVADDSATARHLASSYGRWVYSIRSRRRRHALPGSRHCQPLTEDEHAVVTDRTATQFVGDPDEVAERLETLRRVTDADELVDHLRDAPACRPAALARTDRQAMGRLTG